jgi:hypothetical protein
VSNKVVEASGGILWQRETAAVELIQAGTNCTKEEAREALKVWRKDGRVSSKSDPTARESLDVLRDLKIWWRDGRPPERTSTYEDSINMHELRALLARPKLETPSGADLGASPERRKKKAPRLSASWPCCGRFTRPSPQRRIEKS